MSKRKRKIKKYKQEISFYYHLAKACKTGIFNSIDKWANSFCPIPVVQVSLNIIHSIDTSKWQKKNEKLRSFNINENKKGKKSNNMK